MKVMPDVDAFFKERGFGQRIGFGKHPALIIVDMQVAFTDPNRPLGADQDHIILQIGRVIAAAREVRMSIFFTAVEYDDVDFRDAGIWALKQKGVRASLISTLSMPMSSISKRRFNTCGPMKVRVTKPGELHLRA